MMRENSLRGKLLEFLNDIYPEGADSRSILSIFFEYHKAEDLDRSLEYLTAKEYITRKQVPHPYKKNEHVTIYKITPEGINLMDGLTADPGVAIVPEEDD